MSDTLLGVLLGGGVGILGAVGIQVLLLLHQDRVRKQERAQSIRSVPLDNLMSAVNSVMDVSSLYFFALAARSQGMGSASLDAELVGSGRNAVARLQRAKVSLMALNAFSEVSSAFDEIVILLNALVVTTETEEVTRLLDLVAVVLGQVEGQYMALKKL